jgi:protein phosphatase
VSTSGEDGREDGGTSLSVGACTDKGRVKDQNQDSLFVLNGVLSHEGELLPLGLCIIADGLGGRDAGAQASALAVRLVATRILDEIYRPFLLDTEQPADRQPIHKVLRQAVLLANGRIHQVYPDGRTTLTCAFVLGTNVFIAHAGDSRAYLVSGDSMRRLTTDHSLVHRLIELGQITPEEAATHPQRNVLYRALGRTEDLEVDTYLQPLPADSSLLLCSDGLWGAVSEEAILAIVRAVSSPQSACCRLVARANESGGEDNITAIIVRVRY